MRMGNLFCVTPLASRMVDTDTHPGLSHPTVVPANYDADERSDAPYGRSPGATRGERRRGDGAGR
ncbi:hypothetical protein JCM17092_22650 [Haloplanus litoreus]